MRLLGVTTVGLAMAGLLDVEGFTFLEMIILACLPVCIDAWIRWRIARLETTAALLISRTENADLREEVPTCCVPKRTCSDPSETSEEE